MKKLEKINWKNNFLKKNKLEKSNHNIQWCQKKMDKKVREFQIKERGHHQMLWYASSVLVREIRLRIIT